MTICALAATPEQFDGSVIQVRAHIVTDGIEQTALVSPECSHVAVVLSVEPGAIGAQPITKLLYGRGSLRGIDIEATFRGRFVVRDGLRRLEVTRVQNVAVRQRIEPEQRKATGRRE